MLKRISRWKQQGIKLRDGDDWESVYCYVIVCDNCENCNKKFIDSFDKTLDHDHNTGFIRNILCRSCNSSRR